MKQRIGRRTRQFLGEFPDAIDLMVRAVKSGLPVAEAIQTAADELRNVVAEVFREVTGNLRLGMTLDEALWSAARRIQIPEFKFFVISLAIQQETGGNLSEILQNLGPHDATPRSAETENQSYVIRGPGFGHDHRLLTLYHVWLIYMSMRSI